MDLIVVKKLPEQVRAKASEKELLTLFDEFLDSEASVVRFEWGPDEFGTQYNTVCALRRIIKRYDYPFTVCIICHDVYLSKHA